jgi:hypothetical protein
MRLEAHRNGFGTQLPRPLDDIRKHLTMGAMDAIEIADTDYGRSEVSGNVFELVKNLHRENPPTSAEEI